MKKFLLIIILLIFSLKSYSQTSLVGKAIIQREDGHNIPFNFELKYEGRRPVVYIINAAERLRVDDIEVKRDSVFIKMPFFESAFRARISKGKLNGVWKKGTSGKEVVLPFSAERNSNRFKLANGAAVVNITGRWAVRFATDTSKEPNSVAEFRQKGNKLTGTILTPTGDFRYLEGVVTGNKVFLSAFDGGHAILFTAEIIANKIQNGFFYSGAKYVDTWTAIKDPKATVKFDETAMFLRPGEDRLNFTFPDLEGKQVSINDERFKNKVVIIQLMGSWCPNCMDETQFLSDYYDKNKDRGVEIIALAYEYSTDLARSQQSLRKFQKRFNVNYPILITGVTVSDTLRTEKTLPQVTPIRVFPSSIILDKQGKVRKLDNGFAGQATGKHHEAYKKEFYKNIDLLLQE